MKLTELREGYWALQVPERAYNPRFTFEQSIGRLVRDGKGYDELIIRYDQMICGSPNGKVVIPIPPGTWSIVCTSKEATEEQADRIVEHIEFSIDYYKDYESGGMVRGAENSFISLLTSKGLDLKNTFLILKKQ